MSPPRRLINNNGSIRIRFTHNGTLFNLSKLGAYDNPIAIRFAQSLIDRITLDIRNNSFFCDNNEQLIEVYLPSLKISKPHIPKKDNHQLDKAEDKEIDLRELAMLKLVDSNKDAEKIVYTHLTRYKKKILNKDDVLLFLDWLQKDRNLSSSSVDRYLDVLKTIHPVFKQVHVKVEIKPNPKAFTQEEVKQICNWFQDNRYYPYVRFLFLTGCRISEAIGLRWQYVDLDQRVICFHETLARSDGYSAKRVVKTTKRNIIRYFPISGGLLDLFSGLERGAPDSLVFLVNGRCINDKNFRNREWVRCLTECQIPYRKPSATRHTFISHYLERTKDAVKCAALTHGSKRGVQTIFEHYASLINQVEVPDLY